MASPKTIRRKMEIEARASVVRAEVAQRYAVSHPSLGAQYRGSRTKGLPYSRTTLRHTVPASAGQPAHFLVSHPTKRRKWRLLKATPTLLAVFMPGLPEPLAQHMLGAH